MDILSRILAWAGTEDSVRIILMVGSRAQQNVDEFSDFDLSIFGNDLDFIYDDKWLESIFTPLICIHDQFNWDNQVIPTRLTIFSDMTKVDFSFHPLSLLKEMIINKELRNTYGNGYMIMLDKDGIGQQIPKPGFHAYETDKPEEIKFQLAISEFWFEAYHVAKYLSRGDLWAAKSRDWATKSWLLTMITWHSIISAGHPLQIKSEGREMERWLTPNIYEELNNCFAGFPLQEQWLGLLSTTKLFSMLTRKVAENSYFKYDNRVETKISTFISQLNP
jgi:aminoglycoside 6-adenylyltransferase